MFFELPEGSLADIKDTMAGIIGDFWPIVALILGISIGLFLLASLIGIFRKD